MPDRLEVLEPGSMTGDLSMTMEKDVSKTA